MPIGEFNVRAPRFLLGSSVDRCGRCGALTPVFALALPAGHGVCWPDEDEDGADAAAGADPSLGPWEVCDGVALLFHVERLSAGVESQLLRFAPSLRLVADAVDPGPNHCWANHCGHCQAVLDDHDLFCEPEGAFLPISVAAAERIHFMAIETAFEGFAAGYAYEPAFFAF